MKGLAGGTLAAALCAALASTDAGAEESRAPASVEGWVTAQAEEAVEGAAGEKTEEVLVQRNKRLEPVTDFTVPLDWGGARDALGPEVVRDVVPWSVDELVDKLPGFTSRLYSGDEYVRPSLSGRGMPDNGFTEYISVNVDGMNYSRLIYGWTALSLFPYVPEFTYAVESFRGAHAIRFGPTTLGGVINFITDPIPERLTVGMRTTVGSHGFHSIKMSAGGTDPVSGVGVLVEHVDRGGSTFRDQSDFRVNDSMVKAAVPLGSDALLSIHSFYWRDVHQLMQRLTKDQFENDPDQNPVSPEARWAGWSYGTEVTYLKQVTKDAWCDIQGYERYGMQGTDSTRPGQYPPYTAYRHAGLESLNRGLYARGEFPIQLGTKHLLHGGVRYHTEKADRYSYDTAIAGGAYTQVTRSVVETEALSAHLDDTVKFGDLTLNGGVRYENILDSDGRDTVNDTTRDFSNMDDLLLGASANYAFTKEMAAFTNYHQSTRAPQTWSYDFTNKDQPLDFETGDTGEVGVRVDRWKALSGSLVAWRTDVSDFIEYDDVTDVYTNLGSFSMEGLDLTGLIEGRDLDSALAGWRAYATHTWQDSDFTSGKYDGNDNQHVPKRKLAGDLGYEHERSGFYGTVGFLKRSDTYATPENDVTSPGYTLFNGRIGWRKELPLTDKRVVRLDVAFSVQNLFDKDYHLRHNATQYVPGSPRTYFLEFGISVEL